MSGIAGIFHRDLSPIQEEHLRWQSEALAPPWTRWAGYLVQPSCRIDPPDVPGDPRVAV